MHGTVLLGQDHRPLAPAIIWPDQRTRRQVTEITDRVGAERLVELTGSPVCTGFQAATLRWVQQERPDLWARTRTIMAPKDYLRLRLTGEICTDPSDGSGTLLLDVQRRDWSIEILGTLGIDEEQMPPVQPSTALAGTLTDQAATALGLPAGTPVATGAADTACSAVGAGITGGETLLLTISTGGQLVLPAHEPRVDQEGRIHTFCGALSPAPGQAGWYQMAALLSAGMALRWLRDNVLGLSGPDSYAQMTAWAGTSPPGARGLLFLPYLAGERTPHMDPQARGLWLGLTAGHGKAELVRSVLEGVSMACYDAYKVLQDLGAQPKRITMAGGGARSTLWRQIVADVFGLPVQQLLGADQSALGAALLAGGGIGMQDLATHRWASYGPAMGPDDQRHTLYGELFGLFRAAYRKHHADFSRLESLSSSTELHSRTVTLAA
jgi:xylulokinase